MTRAEVARKLLAMGPLTMREFRETTGWPQRCCIRVLAYLRELGHVRLDRRGGAYEVAR